MSGKVQNERKKIAGNNAKKRESRNERHRPAYSTRCGLVNHNGRRTSCPTEIQVKHGRHGQLSGIRGQYTFSNAKIESDSGVTIGDLNSRIDSIREAADETLQPGVVLGVQPERCCV